MTTFIGKPDRSDKLRQQTTTYRGAVAIGQFDNNEATAVLQDGHVRLDELDEARYSVLRGYNATGATLTKYKFVHFNGFDATTKVDTIALANNTVPDFSLGFLTKDILNANVGYVATQGIMEGVNTAGATIGQPVFLGTNGDFTLTQPTNAQQLGVVLNPSATDGTIYVDTPGAAAQQALPPQDQNKLDDLVNVTDQRFAGGADPTGTNEVSVQVKAAIDYAVTNNIGRVFFPKGVYLWNLPVVLPNTGAGSRYKLMLDFGGSRIITTATAANTLLTRTVTDINDGNAEDYQLRLKDGTVVQTGVAGNGIFCEVQKMGFFQCENMNFESLRTALKIIWCNNHHIRDCNASRCTFPYEVLSGYQLITNATTLNAKPKSGLWFNVRAEMLGTGTAFRASNAEGLRFDRCTVEGTQCGIGWHFEGLMDTTTPLPIERLRVDMNLCKFDVSTTLTNAVVRIENHKRCHFAIGLELTTMPGTQPVILLNNVTESLVEVAGCLGFEDNLGKIWFDPDVPNIASNVWKFINNRLPAGETFNTSGRWTGGNAPGPDVFYETTHDYGNNQLYDSNLTSTPDTILLNRLTSTTFPRPTKISNVAATTARSGSQFLIEQQAGTLASLPHNNVPALNDMVFVTDPEFAGGADPTGSANSQPAIQAAIDYAAANRIGTVYFPRGTYLITATINLPKDASGVARRMTLDFGNSWIELNSDITAFDRTIANINDTQTSYWGMTFQNGTFLNLTTPRNGTAFDIHKCSNVAFNNIRAQTLRTFCRLVFCLEHILINVNATGCLNTYVIRDGDGIFTGVTPGDAQSNVGTWLNVRAQQDDVGSIGFDWSNSSAITAINCVCEGTNALTAYRFAGNQGGGQIEHLTLKMINCWVEFTTTLTQAIELADISAGKLDINLNGWSLPAATLLCKSTGVTRRTVINWIGTQLINGNIANPPLFDANIQAPAADKNVWNFPDWTINTDTKIGDTQYWQGGNVPPLLQERTFKVNQTKIHDSYLTISPNSLLLNPEASEELARGTAIGSLPNISVAPSTLALVQSPAGVLSNIDLNSLVISGANRKDGADDLGTITTGTLTIDFDLLNKDNKQFTIDTANIATATFTATRTGTYLLYVIQGGSGGWQLDLSNVNTSPALSNVPLVYTAGAVTVLPFHFHAPSGIWSW